MKALIVILFLSVLAAPAFAQSKVDSEPAPDTLDRKAVKGFGGQLIVVENPRAFIEEWLKPETPHIKPATDVKHRATLGTFVLFGGCKPDAQGVCNAEVDYTIYKPDGTVLAELKAQPLWDEQAPPAPNIQLGKAILAFGLGDDEPDGEYKVKAKVSDRNANISFELETKFRLK